MDGPRTAQIYDWCPKGRWLHLVDAENLCGTGAPTAADMLRVRRRYFEVMRPGPHDHTIVASSHHAGLVIGAGWPGARLVLGSGVDGADRALLGAVRPAQEMVQRFAGIVIASGDHIFADLAIDLAQAGGTVVVTCGEGRLSRQLAEHAAAVLPLFDDTVLAA